MNNIERTSIGLDGLIAELEGFRAGNYDGDTEVLIFSEAGDVFDILDVYAERGQVYLHVRPRD